jgi:hypothetical protein
MVDTAKWGVHPPPSPAWDDFTLVMECTVRHKVAIATLFVLCGRYGLSEQAGRTVLYCTNHACCMGHSFLAKLGRTPCWASPLALRLAGQSTEVEGCRELDLNGVLPSLAGGEWSGRCNMYCDW